MLQPLVDVIIPAHNRAALLHEAIDSVLQQSFKKLRLIVVDDASDLPLSQQVGISDSRLSFLRLEKNAGPARARNRGAEKGTAPYIAFLDSDDLWTPEKLSRQIDFFTAHPEYQWVHCNEEWRRGDVVVKQRSDFRKQGGQFLDRAIERCLISASCAVFRRAFFERHGGFVPSFRLCEDYELWLRMLANEPVGFLPEPLAIKRTGNWSQLSATPQIDRYRVLALHRFYRHRKTHQLSEGLVGEVLSEAQNKCAILKKGSEKYAGTDSEATRRYQAWFTLFNTLRTRAMR